MIPYCVLACVLTTEARRSGHAAALLRASSSVENVRVVSKELGEQFWIMHDLTNPTNEAAEHSCLRRARDHAVRQRQQRRRIDRSAIDREQKPPHCPWSWKEFGLTARGKSRWMEPQQWVPM